MGLKPENHEHPGQIEELRRAAPFQPRSSAGGAGDFASPRKLNITARGASAAVGVDGKSSVPRKL